MPPKQDRKARAGAVRCHWCGLFFVETRKRDYHQEICEFFGASITPRAQDIRMPQGFMVFRTFCNENRVLSKKYRDAFLAYVKKGQPDLLKLTEEYLDAAFTEYKHG